VCIVIALLQDSNCLMAQDCCLLLKEFWRHPLGSM
jgi:hypothetical protein